MKKQGFTLIELIGSIVILAIVALIAFPTIINVLKTSQEKVDTSTKQLIESAAYKYVNDNKDSYPQPGGPYTNISPKKLCSEGYLEDNFCKKNELTDKTTVVKVTVVSSSHYNNITGKNETFYRYKCEYQG